MHAERRKHPSSTAEQGCGKLCSQLCSHARESRASRNCSSRKMPLSNPSAKGRVQESAGLKASHALLGAVVHRLDRRLRNFWFTLAILATSRRFGIFVQLPSCPRSKNFLVLERFEIACVSAQFGISTVSISPLLNAFWAHSELSARLRAARNTWTTCEKVAQIWGEKGTKMTGQCA